MLMDSANLIFLWRSEFRNRNFMLEGMICHFAAHNKPLEETAKSAAFLR